MSICSAYLLKGWLLAERAPAEVMEAVESVIKCLKATQPDAVEDRLEISPLAVTPVEPADTPDKPARDDPTEQPPPPKKKHNWSPEARAAAAERMRKMQEAGLLKRKALVEPGEAEAPRL